LERRIKAISKKQKIMLAPAGASTDSDEGAAESVHEGTASVATSVGDDTGMGRASTAGSEVVGTEGCGLSKKASIVEESKDESEGRSLPT
jgi:hypothetical protein